MDETSKFRVVAWWASGQTGITKSDSAASAVHFSAPVQFGGTVGRWTPEDLLLSSLASCFTTTFQVVAEYSKFAYRDLEVEVEGTVERTGNGYCFTKLMVRPKLAIFDENYRHKALQLLNKTKSVCVISRALEVPQDFEPCVVTERLMPVGQAAVSMNFSEEV